MLDGRPERLDRLRAPARGDGPALRRCADLGRRRQGGIGRDDGHGRGARSRRGRSPSRSCTRWPPRSTASATAPATAARSRSSTSSSPACTSPPPPRRWRSACAKASTRRRSTTSSRTAPATAGCSRTAWRTCSPATTRRSRRSTSSSRTSASSSTPRARPSSRCRWRARRTRCSCRRRRAGFAKEDDAAVIKIFPGIELPGGKMTIRLGCIADDFTGATDLANNLVRAGMRAVQTIGVPGDDAARRSTPMRSSSRSSRARSRRELAVEQSLAACRWLRRAGATQIYFKVCSTFDSTPRGNIGPVARGADGRARLRASRSRRRRSPTTRARSSRAICSSATCCSRTAACAHHPLTPMTDANLVRVLQAQLAPARRDGRAPRRVGLVDHRATGASAAAIRARFDALAQRRRRDRDRRRDRQRRPACASARRFATLPLVCAGSGLAIGLPRNFGIAAVGRGGVAAGGEGLQRHRLRQLLGRRPTRRSPRSCAAAARRAASIRSQLGDGDDEAARRRHRRAGPNASGPRRRTDRCSSTAPRRRRRSPRRRRSSGAHDVGARLEHAARRHRRRRSSRAARAASSSPAARPRARACRRSASSRLRIGRQIDPGVPWCHAAPAAAPDGLQLALKSGNFGAVDFFARAFVVARGCTMSEARTARRAVPRRPLAPRARLRARHDRQPERAPATTASSSPPTDACLGDLDPAALVKVDAAGHAAPGAGQPSKTLALHRRIYAAAAEAGCIVHTHSRASRGAEPRDPRATRTATTCCRRSRRTS